MTLKPATLPAPPSYSEYCSAFEAKGAKVVFQFRISRSGSFLVHSLFDGHPELLTFPGPVNFYTLLYPEIQKAPERWADSFRRMLTLWWQAEHSNTQRKLGRDRTESILLDRERLVARMEAALPERTPTSRRLFLAFHYALGLELGQDLRAATALYEHEHPDVFERSCLDTLLRDFPSATLLCTVRDPRAVYPSMLRYREGVRRAGYVEWADSIHVRYQSWDVYDSLLSLIEAYPERFQIVKFETLRRTPEPMMRKLAALGGLPFHPTLLQSTFGGKLFWGDDFSPPANGVSPEKKTPREMLSPIELAAIEIAMKPILEALQYTRLHRPGSWAWFLALLCYPLWARDDEGQRRHFRQRPFLRHAPRGLLRYVRAELLILRRLVSRRPAYRNVSRRVIPREELEGNPRKGAGRAQ